MSTDPSKSQDQPVPAPTDTATASGTKSSPATVTGTTKVDNEWLQFYIDMVERQIQEESNPARRENAQVCLEFVRKHGYPAQGYRFLVYQGITEVLTEEQDMDRDGELLRRVGGSFQDTYGLVCCWPSSKPLFCNLAFTILLTRSSILPGKKASEQRSDISMLAFFQLPSIISVTK